MTGREEGFAGLFRMPIPGSASCALGDPFSPNRDS